MIDITKIVNRIKQEIINYTGDESLSNIVTNDIHMSFLDSETFLKLSGADSIGQVGGFYREKDKTIYLLKQDSFTNNDLHRLIHEMLHFYSDHHFNYGKAGFQVYGYDENDKEISAGGALNEAATEYLTSIINSDGFVGYPDDMKYIFELFIDVLNVRTNFVNMYFQTEDWITNEMNKRFNSSKENQLDEFVLEFDNRIPMYRKHPYDFNKTFSILLDAINDKIINHVDINYESIVKNIFMITRCDFDLNQDNLSKIKYLQEVVKSVYGVEYKQDDLINDNYFDDGKIRLGH